MKQRNAELVLVGLTAIWGMTFPLTRGLVQKFSASDMVFLRFLVGVLFLAVFRPFALRELTARQWKIAAGLGVLLFASYMFQTLGLRYTTSARGGFITALNVIIVPFVAAVLIRERVTLLVKTGLVLAVAGLTVLGLDASRAADITGRSESLVWWGDFLVFLCAVLFSFHIVLVAKFSRELPTFAGSLAQMIVVAVFAGIVTFFEGSFALPSGEDLPAFFFLSIIGTALVFLLQIKAQKHTAATHAGLIFSLEPVFATLFGWLIASEPVTVKTMVAGALMMLGVALPFGRRGRVSG